MDDKGRRCTKIADSPTFLETDEGGLQEAAPIILLFVQVLKKQVIDFQERILSETRENGSFCKGLHSPRHESTRNSLVRHRRRSFCELRLLGTEDRASIPSCEGQDFQTFLER